MEFEQIKTTLEKKFEEPLVSGEHRKIIFWYDEGGQFEELIADLQLKNTKIQKLKERNSFAVKYLIEVEDKESNYLLYATKRPYPEEENWLMDMLLYSYEFYADKLSMIMDELGIDISLRSVVKQYEKFFAAKERRMKLKSLCGKGFTESSIERAMMAVICNSKSLEFEEVLRSILDEGIEDDENRFLLELEKYSLKEAFWKRIASLYGFDKNEHSLKRFAAHLFVNSMSLAIDPLYLKDFENLLVKDSCIECNVFLFHWMNNRLSMQCFQDIEKEISELLSVKERLSTVHIERLLECDVFKAIDIQVLRYLSEAIIDGNEDFESLLQIIEKRRNKYWYPKFETIYESMNCAIKLKAFKNKVIAIPKVRAKEIYSLYTTEYFKADSLYRGFYTYFDQNPIELLKPVCKLVENLYTNWYQDELNTAWSAAIGCELSDGWKIEGVMNQDQFYDKEIKKLIDDDKRCFVIVSDAFRYEVAVDLKDRLEYETAGSVKLETMLSVIPSRTKYGMAALLPHKKISMDEMTGIRIDGVDVSSIQGRETALKNVVQDSIAVHSQNIFKMMKEERKELIKGNKLIYIYHDSIDARGDKPATENEVFDAAKKALTELFRLVQIIRDDFSGVYIFITADHGFIYQRDALSESDKVGREIKNPLEQTRRYVVSKENVNTENLMKFNMEYIDNLQLNVYVPRTTIRFKIQGGGANFVHGGASLQEVVVPLIKYKAVRGGNTKAKEVKKVNLKLANEVRKITNSIFTLEFFQTEKVDDKSAPRIVEVYLEDANKNILTNREKIIADRASDKPDERTFKIKFALKAAKYDKSGEYYLIIKDTETDMVEKLTFTINLAIASDFDL